MSENSLPLRYGMNPHQKPAKVYVSGGNLPFAVLNGAPGYINLLDALNSWQLVRELKQATNLPAAASFKHVSPAGAAVGTPLSDTLKKAYFVGGIELTPTATAYARARGADRLCSFGDWVAISDTVDIATAKLLNQEVSDGIIAPGYEAEALEILKKKKQGSYVILQIDPNYEPFEMEVREVFGVKFEQKRNNLLLTPEVLQNVVTAAKSLPTMAMRDLLVALITLKYTQSNSICFAYDGQIIGVGAGQQSRIHCTRLAGAKADTWYMRQHPAVLNLKFKPGVKRPDRDNAIDNFLRDDLSDGEKTALQEQLDEPLRQLTPAEKREWLTTLSGVALGSDGFIPFRDTVDRGAQSGVKYIVQPGNSIRDAEVIAACEEYGILMAFTGVRLFHH
jgi:phosphoribosylaminoimidazolecarboxamide formyltransferase / IMP cyclohydrolase